MRRDNDWFCNGHGVTTDRAKEVESADFCNKHEVKTGEVLDIDDSTKKVNVSDSIQS